MRWSKRGPPFDPLKVAFRESRIQALVSPATPVYMASCPPPPLSELQLRALLDVLLLALNIYTWIIIAAAIFSWLFAFGVVNASNQFVATIGRMLYQLTEPALRPIRRVLPAFGGLDLSPIVLLLLIFLIERIIIYYVYPYVF